MQTRTKVAIGAALGFAAGIALSYLVSLDFAANGFLKNQWDTFFQPPRSATKIFAVLAALLVLAALPFGILEWRADARFRKEERRLREERPTAEVSPYEGSEGRGLLFSDPMGEVLLVSPAGGLRGPAVIDRPAASTAPPAETP